MSLTELQQSKLELETHHCSPRYSKILKDAIETWKIDYVIPRTNGFGVKFSSEKGKFIFNNWHSTKDKYNCCILGAALLGKYRNNPFNGFFDCIAENFYITKHEAIGISNGFDNCFNTKFNFKSKCASFMFGYKIGKILFTEEIEK